MFFSDIHMHILYGTDDGPKTPEEMFKMADIAYKNGTRLICATPHFCPGNFGDNRERSEQAFKVLKEYCKEKYPDLKLYLGNEFYYLLEGLSWLKSGVCHTMGNTRYALVEFDVNASENEIAEGIDRILNSGFVPIIAHAERYRKLSFKRLWAIRQNGALVQVNAQSFKTDFFTLGVKARLKVMLFENGVDFVSSDAHGLVHRVPDMTYAYNYLVEKYGDEYAERLCHGNAENLIFADMSEEDK